MRVIVIGAGVAGISAGVAVQQAGHDVVVLERRPALDDSQRGELIWASGMDALERLGVAAAIRSAGSPLVDEDFRSRRGGSLYRVPVRELAVAAGRPEPTVIRRSDLLRTLAGALHEGTLRLGAETTHVEQEHGAASVTLAGGGTEHADVVLTADGSRSRFRTTVLGGPYAAISRATWAHGVVPLEEGWLAEGRTLIALGKGDRIVVRDLGGGSASWLAVLADGRPATPERLLDRFGSFAAPVPALLESTPRDVIETEDVRWVETLERWHEGRVVLLGDAAHGASPSLARGAGEALTDAVTLGALLAEREPDDAIATYVAERMPATAAVQAEAQRLERIFGQRRQPAVMLREQVMRRILSRKVRDRIAAELRA